MQRIPIIAIPLDLEPELLVRGVEAVLAPVELPRQGVGRVTLVPGAVVGDADAGDLVVVA